MVHSPGTLNAQCVAPQRQVDMEIPLLIGSDMRRKCAPLVDNSYLPGDRPLIGFAEPADRRRRAKHNLSLNSSGLGRETGRSRKCHSAEQRQNAEKKARSAGHWFSSTDFRLTRRVRV